MSGRAAGGRTRHRRGPVAATAVAVVLLCSGCLFSGVPTVDLSKFHITPDVVAVVGFSPQLSDAQIVGNGSHGFVMLISSDGSARSLKIGTMPGITPLWAGEELRFRDIDTDYVVTATDAHAEPDPVQAPQMGAFEGVDGYAAVARYDVGVLKPGAPYLQDVVAIDGHGHLEHASVIGSGITDAVCNGVLYGITDARTRTHSPGADDSVQPGLVLLQEFPRPPAGASDVVASVPLDGAPSFAGLGASCSGTRAVLLGQGAGSRLHDVLRASVGLEKPPPDAATPVIATWDVATGALTAVALHDDSGLPLPVERSTVGRGSVVGDDLYWYADSGVVYRSSISTGATSEAFRTAPDPVNVGPGGRIDHNAAVLFRDGTLYHFSVATSGDEPGTLSAWTLSTGERQFEITVPAAGTVAGEPGHFQRPWGVAIRPGLDPASVH